jgi:hypothetical protein
MQDIMVPPSFIALVPDSPWENPEPDGKSAVERLFAQLEAHEREEAESVKEYREAATQAPDAGYRFLMGLVLQDEERHHQLSQDMAAEVRQSLLWLREDEPLPAMHPAPQARQALLDQTERFLRVEEDGERELTGLRHHVKDLNSGLLELIIDLMLSDTQKHVHILKYIRKQLKER